MHDLIRLSLLPSIAAIALFSTAALAQQPEKPADLAQAAAALENRVAKLEASGETSTLAIAQISTRLAELTQRIEALSGAQTTSPELVGRVDQLAERTAVLSGELESLRTKIADLEQPYSAAGGETSGFTLSGGGYSATISAYLHAGWLFLTPSDFATITESTFRIRRARLGLSGNGGELLGKKVTYKLLAELIGEPSLRDAHVDVAIMPELSVRLGQAKVQHTRIFIMSSTRLLFPERSFANDSFRYDRDVGAWALGKLLDGKLEYSAGLSNGGGPNALNDNIDFAISARVQGAVLGEMISYAEGDVGQTEEASLTVGLSAVHDLVQLPDIVGGILVAERDVDADEVIDNVRVLSLAADATFRLKGIEVAVEAYLRRESWGTILDHSANEEIGALIGANNEGNRTYTGVVGEGSYFVLPGKVAVGGRLGYSEQTYLGVGGRRGQSPPADRLLELSLVGQLFGRNKLRMLGLDYTLTNYDNSAGAEPAFDIEHRFIVDSQLAF